MNLYSFILLLVVIFGQICPLVLQFLIVRKLKIKDDLRRQSVKNSSCDISDTLR